MPFWAWTEFRLLMRCFGLGYVWKSLWDKYVQHATLHINKSVYLTDFRRKITKANTGPMLGCRWFRYSQECIIY